MKINPVSYTHLDVYKRQVLAGEDLSYHESTSTGFDDIYKIMITSQLLANAWLVELGNTNKYVYINFLKQFPIIR